MRRKLAYIILTSALILGVGSIIGASIVKMDTDVSYGAGKDLYFRISNKDSALTGLTPDEYIGNDNYLGVDDVASVMEDRLQTWGVNASVAKEGFDTVKVSIRAQGADDTEYGYLENYLSFSGQNITLGIGTSDPDVIKNAPADASYLNNAMFDGQTAAITYVNNVPVVTIPVNKTGKDGLFDKLISYCNSNTKAANSSEGTSATDCYLVLWNNFQEGDTFSSATDTKSANYDANMTKRLFFGENASNAWYVDKNNSDNDYKQFQIIPNSEAIKNGNYDSSKAGAAYKAAFYYMNILNASSYRDLGEGYDVTFAYATDIAASTENLITAGDWHLTTNFGATIIASLAALAIAAFALALFYHFGALAILSNVGIAVEGAILLFAYFSAQFGIGAVIGLLLAALVTAFGGIYYFAKMKEELYEGRNPRKAHSEAIKKALWPTLDVGIISIIVGLCVYVWVPSVVGKLGLMLVLGAFFGTVANILLLRLEGWLLANDSSTEAKFDSLYFVDQEKIPDALKEEKQTFFGPYANKDFQKRKNLVAIIGGGLVVASIVGIALFTALNGSSYNYADTYSDTTSLSLEYRVDNGTSETLLMYTKDQVESDYLPLITYNVVSNGQTTSTALDQLYGDIVLEQETLYSTIDLKKYDVYYFSIPLTEYLPVTGGDDNTFYFTVSGSEGGTFYSLEESVEAAARYFKGLTAEGELVQYEAGIPTLGEVYLGLGIGMIFVFAYLLLRFKASRAIAAMVISLAAGLLVIGFFSLTRLAVSPLVSSGAIVVTLLTVFLCLILFNKDHEINKESRERDKASLAFQNLCLKQANGQAAGDLIIYGLIASGCLIFYVGFAPSAYFYAFLGALVGLALALPLVLVLLTPLTEALTKLFSLIHLSFKNNHHRDSGNPTGGKKKGTEPEEAVFIGIND
jgi:hypothetical protein